MAVGRMSGYKTPYSIKRSSVIVGRHPRMGSRRNGRRRWKAKPIETDSVARVAYELDISREYSLARLEQFRVSH